MFGFSLIKVHLYFFLKYIILFIWLCQFFTAVWGCSLDVVSRDYSLVAVSRLLVVVASLAAGHGLWGSQDSVVVAHVLSSCGSWALEHRLSICSACTCCSTACGIFLDQGLNLCLLHWQVDSLPVNHQGNPHLDS